MSLRRALETQKVKAQERLVQICKFFTCRTVVFHLMVLFCLRTCNLGKIVGDAWGKVFLKKEIAKALAAFSIIVPPA
jgi:hypothetical protein